MKKKIISMIIVVMLLLSYSNYIFAAVRYTRTGGTDLRNIAHDMDDNDLWIEEKYNAVSRSYNFSNVDIYDYNTTNRKQNVEAGTQITYSDSNKNQFFYWVDQAVEYVQNGETKKYDELYYAIKLGVGEQTATDVATFVFKNGIQFNGVNYNVKLNLKNIEKEGTEEQIVCVRIGSRPEAADNLYDLSTYTNNTTISIRAHKSDAGNKTEIGVEYSAIDDDGNVIPISGVFGVTDVDLNQGVYIDDFIANQNNTFMKKKDSNNVDVTEIYYKTDTNGTYIYSTTDANNDERNAYTLIDNKSKIDMVFTFDTKAAGSSVRFVRDINRYKKITTKVTGGTITESITNIKDGENKTIEYTPGENKYLVSVKVDGTDVDITQYPESYTFSNITADHEIEVLYADKLAITHDPKGGTPTPDVQYVKPNETATAVTEPTKAGYTFAGWQKEGETTPYDYTTPVTENITIEAVWTPNEYTITYITNEGVNDPTNPTTYKTGDTKDFQNPTRDGYNFLGWYEDENFTTRKDGIGATDIGNKTVYAKWEAATGISYKVEHYKETTNGNYELVVTDNLTGNANQTVTATPKEYPGFEENKTHTNRVASGTVLNDGSLVLKLYYDKIEYKVTFDTDGGSKNPADQIVKYQEKATEPTDPTKSGYTFEYWYYINDEGKKVQYDFSDPVTKNMNLIAKWEKVEKETKKANGSTPSSLPKTGGKIAFISIFGIIALIAVIFRIKYSKLKGI